MRRSFARVLAVALALALAWPLATLAQEPKVGAPVVHAISPDPPTMTPATTTDTQAWSLMGKLFNGLTYLDNDYRSHPDLAESWTISPDGVPYRVKVRRAV